jgi:hypothetical protein
MDDLQQAMEKRKAWFFECQLRRFNLDSFRGIHEPIPGSTEPPDPLLDLVSEQLLSLGFPVGQVGKLQPQVGKLQGLGRVYLDSQRPVWTIEEREQRDAFDSGLIGEIVDWLDFKQPKRIVEKLDELKKMFESSPFASVTENNPELNRFNRKDVSGEKELSHAISRSYITIQKPWLIPEIYNFFPNADATSAEKWIENAKTFIGNYENELLQLCGKPHDTVIKFDKDQPNQYKNAIQLLMEQTLTQNSSDFVKVSFLGDDECGKKSWDLKIQTVDFPLGKIADYSFSKHLIYWSDAFDLREIYLNAANSDMGLCIRMRALYLFGTLPATLGTDDQLVWRKRLAPDDKFQQFFSQVAHDKFIAEDPNHREDFENLKSKLTALLELQAALPRSAVLSFSLLNAEFFKQALLNYKFWLDEPFYAYNNHGVEGKEDRDKEQGINKARVDIGKGKPYQEMEYWSENHYIMFASSEFLAGQLWPQETFQPARDFLSPAHDELFQLTGEKRQARAKARVMKWLNNKLIFGWTEFNSSGYYREHMWALLNLVDFALDEGVKKKATLVLDLLLFDLVRFNHKGSMGAAGGRSQFKSRCNGWDNAPPDVIEMMLGTRGIFEDGNGELGCHFATTTYKVPDVLLEIGKNPPDFSFTDRSRVSISFEEAPKYDIQYSQKSDQKDSVERGFRPKRDKHFKALAEVNEAIRSSHNDYGQMEDDTVFWWGMSAYYNKQVVRNTFTCRDKFHLRKNDPFTGFLPKLIKFLLPLLRRSGYGVLGGLTAVASGLTAGIAGVAAGFFLDDILGNSDKEGSSNELSIFLEGSTRTRANIFTYRNKDVMLSSIQNFRPGQLNFQSNVQQATISGEINIFTTSAFPGFSISDITAGLAGYALGAVGGIAVAAGAIIANESAIEGENPLGDDEDGPGYWTGYWALPMVLQHENAAIIAYDFHWIQNRLTDTGSHTWFPKNAFDSVEERRTSSYEDENFFLLDITDIGPKGFWIFGKKIHKQNFQNPQEDEESYIGLFSNQRPEWLNKDSDFYSDKVKEKNEKALEKIEDDIKKKLGELEDEDTVGYIGKQVLETVTLRSVKSRYKRNISKEDWVGLVKNDLSLSKAAIIRKNLCKIIELVSLYIDRENHNRTWAHPLSEDYFADKDWSVDGKNIWIIQVGNKKEYGSFDNFKDRVSKAKIELDDVGTMECTYHIPKPDGGSQALSLEYGGACKLDGNSFQTDHYPRFENPFVRGGRVEWGQRSYVIEYHGKSLLHLYDGSMNVFRLESSPILPADLDTILALVIYIKTGDENMDQFSVGQATIKSGCYTLATDEIVAVGEVDDNTTHDAEFIFFDPPGSPTFFDPDPPGRLTPDMTIEIKHPATSDGDDDPEWKMSFSLKALMGDYRLYDCALSFTYCHFKDERRSSGALPFTVQVSRWRNWQPLLENATFDFWQVALQSGYETYYYDYFDLLAIDASRNLLHRKVATCAASSTDWKVLGDTGSIPLFKPPFSCYSLSTQPGNLFVFAITEAKLFWHGGDFSAKWISLEPQTILHTIFGLPVPNAPPIPVPLSLQSQVFATASTDFLQGILDLYISGADGNFYSLTAWYPHSTQYWRKIETSGVFTPLLGDTFFVCANHLFTLDNQHRLWVGKLEPGDLSITPSWVQLTSNSIKVNSFVIAQKGTLITLLLNTNAGEIHAAPFTSADQPLVWERVGASVNFLAFPQAKIVWAVPREGHLDIFTTKQDGKIYTTYWEASQGWETNHNWFLLEPNSQTFTTTTPTNIVALNRVKNQLEIVTQGTDLRMWKTWWT